MGNNNPNLPTNNGRVKELTPVEFKALQNEVRHLRETVELQNEVITSQSALILDELASLKMMVQVQTPSEPPAPLECGYLTTKEAVKFLGISKSSLDKKVASGEIPCHKFGKLNKFNLDELKTYRDSVLTRKSA